MDFPNPRQAMRIAYDKHHGSVYLIGCDEIEVPPGCTPLWAAEDDNILLLDLDSEEALKTFIERLGDVEAVWGVDNLYIYPSLGGNVHAVVHLHEGEERMTKPLRAALQLFLGSDPYREFLYLHQEDGECVLFYPLCWKENVYGGLSGLIEVIGSEETPF